MLWRATNSLDNGLWCLENFHDTPLACDSTKYNTGGFTWCHKISNWSIVSLTIWWLHLASFHIHIYFRKLLQSFQKAFSVSCSSPYCLLYPGTPSLSPLNPSIVFPLWFFLTLYLHFHGGSLPPPGSNYPVSVIIWIETFILKANFHL